MIHGGFWVTLERKTRKYDPSHNSSQSLKQTMFAHVQMWLTMWFLAEDWLYLGGIHINFMRKKISNAFPTFIYITKGAYFFALLYTKFLPWLRGGMIFFMGFEGYLQTELHRRVKGYFSIFLMVFFSIYTLFRLWEN